MPISRRRRVLAGQDESAEETLARVRGTLDGYLTLGRQQGGQDVEVGVRHVIDLLDPRGTWRLARQRVASEAVEDPGGPVDPITGCKPV